MIRAWLVGDEQVVARFKALPGKVNRHLLRTMVSLSLQLIAHIQRSKLTGQVLKAQSSTLRRSIVNQIQVREDAIFALVGTNVPYAAKHEYGFEGTEDVGETFVKAHLRKIKQAFGKSLKKPKKVSVRAHMRDPYTRTVRFPERSFLRSSLKDLDDRIKRGMESALGEAVSE